jgi:hypothetical protein
MEMSKGNIIFSGVESLIDTRRLQVLAQILGLHHWPSTGLTNVVQVEVLFKYI